MSAVLLYGSRPTKRRTRADIAHIRSLMVALLAREQPMTVRQVFYRLVSLGAIAKTEAEYKGTVVRLLGDLRREGVIRWNWLADATRWMRKPRTYDSVAEALEDVATFYRRSLWRNSEYYLEVWCEKEALAGVLYDVTSRYDVPLMVTRGYPSLSYLHEAAAVMADKIAVGKVVRICYLGDFDPSGEDIFRYLHETLREFVREMTPGRSWADQLQVELLAVQPWQINEWQLPTRPTKRTDPRQQRFGRESVELDAIPPGTLKELVEDAILEVLPSRALEIARVAEESEREVLMRFRDLVDTAAGRDGRGLIEAVVDVAAAVQELDDVEDER